MTKYILMFLMLFYTLLCFRINSLSEERDIRVKLLIQRIIIMIIFVMCAVIILNYRFSLTALILFMLEILYLIIFPMLFHTIYPMSSGAIMNNMLMMLSLGFIMLERLNSDNAIKQFLIVIAGSVVFFLIPQIVKKKKLLKKTGFVMAIAGIVLLFITLVLGKTSFGANISFTIAGFTFQPSEFVKILFVLFVASLISGGKDLKTIIVASIVAGIHIIILVASTDLGSSLIFFVVYLVMLYVGTGKIIYPAIGTMVGAGASVLAYNIFSHIKVRVLAWSNPWSDIDGKGYQITQSLFAIGTGGFFGLGLCKGYPESIPVVSKDFVFAAIAEEFGIIFGICLILVCISIFLEIMKLSSVCRNKMLKLIAAGFGSMYIFQCFLTIGGVIKFIPSTGVTLPLISYGGSSIIMSLVMFSIIQGIFMSVREDCNEKEEKSQHI